MCLYPKLILNKKYLPTKKNNYRPPKLHDERLKYVAVGCGNCIECRKQKARMWNTRLKEELKTQRAYFVTLTFSEESINKIVENIQCDESNIVAEYGVRHFLERWRKVHKKSIRHWLITELGHTNTERIHIHGIIFCECIDNTQLQTFWKYGKTDIGEYCNNRTINYIVKYVTKIDNDHKGYMPKIFCSAGIGASYVNDFNRHKHRYKPNETNERYTNEDGTPSNLPIYYRNKFFTEEEREKLWLEKIELQTIYVRGIKCDISTPKGIEEYLGLLEEQQRQNINLGYGDDSENWTRKFYKARLKNINAKSK